MRKGYTITLGILTILILITITIGTSYSFYSISKEQTDPNEVTTACFKVGFEESDTITLNNQVSETGEYTYAYPMSETTALNKYKPYKMTISNTCTSENSSASINYVIAINATIDSTLNTSLPHDKLRYRIDEVGGTDVTRAVLNTTSYTIPDNTVYTPTDYGTYALKTGSLSAGTSISYNLYLWIDEAATLDDVTIVNETTNNREGKTFSGKILVYSYMGSAS